jgi:hypothetical protein
MRTILVWAFGLLALPALAAERKLDFSNYTEGQLPTNFLSVAVGPGGPAKWQIVLDDVATDLVPLTPQAPSVMKRPVLGQLSGNPTDERFCICILQDEIFDDFKLTTQFKTVRGVMEQMAGIAFRIQNESNYYVVRGSSLGNTFRFYRVRDGVRSAPEGPEIPVTNGVWHELAIECKANTIRASLDGKEYLATKDEIKPYLSGKIGYWTKSDSVSYFCDTRIVYDPHESPFQKVLQKVLKSHARLLDLQIYTLGMEPGTTRLAASKSGEGIGRAGGKTELEVITQGTTFYGKEQDSFSVVLPVRDRNGDPVAAMRVVMKPFVGQTQANAIGSAAPIAAEIQDRIRGMDELNR